MNALYFGDNLEVSEKLGYPTQKPLTLLERIIAASSNEGDVVLDPRPQQPQVVFLSAVQE